jgi:hypothetical protein
LQTTGQDEGEDTGEERRPMVEQWKIGRFIVNIDGKRAGFPGLFGPLPQGSLQRVRSGKRRAHNGGNTLKLQVNRDGLRHVPRHYYYFVSFVLYLCS